MFLVGWTKADPTVAVRFGGPSMTVATFFK